ncbi:MAG TPA: hypothetical protein VER58_10295 [Thermoanaerobaculia bacterium]|nr:hypothetical protein [Thermoanaerobaculia bacterium]
MTDAEKLTACLREIGFEADVRPVDYTEDFRGLAPPKVIRQRINVGCHFLFDAEGKLVAVQSEYDGWVSSASADAISIVGYQTADLDGLGRRVVAVDLLFRDATHARKLLSLREYRDAGSGRTVYVLPDTPTVTEEGVVHTLRFRHT